MKLIKDWELKELEAAREELAMAGIGGEFVLQSAREVKERLERERATYTPYSTETERKRWSELGGQLSVINQILAPGFGQHDRLTRMIEVKQKERMEARQKADRRARKVGAPEA